MNTWLIVAIIAGLVMFAGVAILANTQIAKAADQTPTSSKTCTGCENKCTAESNCGLARCGAANGGKCTCGK